MSLDPGDCILVFAHPDDEVLWASALLARARAVILCFGDMHKPAVSEGRRRALAAYPLPNVESLAIPEAGVFERAAWPDPPPAPDGLALRADLPAQEADRPRRYGANFARLTELLRPRLTGARTVVTHNPWGEYGHEEHVQLFRAVEALQRELGFALWVTGYVSEKSESLMARSIPHLQAESVVLPTDPDLGARLQTLYTETGCWTWYDDYAWPATESFHRWSPAPQPARPGATLALTRIWLGWTPKRRSSRLRRLARRLFPRRPG